MSQDAPKRSLNWGDAKPDVDYASRRETTPKSTETVKPPKAVAPLREWEAEEMKGTASATVVLPAEVLAKLKWLIPSSKTKPKDELSMRQRLAKIDVFDNTAHAYMVRKLTEAIEADFRKADRIWKEDQGIK